MWSLQYQSEILSAHFTTLVGSVMTTGGSAIYFMYNVHFNNIIDEIATALSVLT